MNISNFHQVLMWMVKIGQIKKEKTSIILPDLKTLKLRHDLILEETKELHAEFTRIHQLYEEPHDNDERAALVADFIKECCDVLVVVYGTLAAFEVDGDVVFEMVMDNNFGKVEKGTFNEIGKLVVDADTKAELKREMFAKLTAYIKNGSY